MRIPKLVYPDRTDEERGIFTKKLFRAVSMSRDRERKSALPRYTQRLTALLREIRRVVARERGPR
jgi:hypothetical protein